jgi:hypothetical protein
VIEASVLCSAGFAGVLVLASVEVGPVVFPVVLSSVPVGVPVMDDVSVYNWRGNPMGQRCGMAANERGENNFPLVNHGSTNQRGQQRSWLLSDKSERVFPLSYDMTGSKMGTT